jgi:hypothetical protein
MGLGGTDRGQPAAQPQREAEEKRSAGTERRREERGSGGKRKKWEWRTMSFIRDS